jgi:hypothetical protein
MKSYTKQRHRYLAAIWQAGGLRPRPGRQRESFNLFELGMLDWVYPTPSGLLQGPEARACHPEEWPEIRAHALERMTLYGTTTLSEWSRHRTI